MNSQNPYASSFSVAQAPADARTEFYQKTYLHLAGAVGALIVLVALLFQTPLPVAFLKLIGAGQFSWLIVLGVFMAVSWVAQKWAYSNTSRGMQYAGLGLYVVAEAIILLPLLTIAILYTGSGPELIMQAGIITGGLFAGLTFVAFTTKKDFSFLSGIIKVGFFVALGLIVASFFFGGLNLGVWFMGAMVLLLGATILYQTSQIIHNFGTEQYVAASLGLFASLATLFFYVLQILLSFTGDD